MGEGAGRYSNHIDRHCSYCGAIEDDQHLFFKCALSLEVWSSFDPPVQLNSFPPEEDGIQSFLSLMLTPNPCDDLLFKTLFVLWYIRKAHNDNRFNRRTWTSLQIHHAAKAHMRTHLEALHENEAPTVIHQSGDDVNQTTLFTNISGMSNFAVGTSRGEALREATFADSFPYHFTRIPMLHRCFHTT